MIDAVWLRIVLVALAGWVNRHQLEVIEYLREENRVLKERLGGRRLRLTDAQRRRLAMILRQPQRHREEIQYLALMRLSSTHSQG